MRSSKVEIPEKFVSETRRTCYISKRYILTFFAWWGMVNIYCMRVNLSVAMVAMVNNTKNTSINDSLPVLECPNLIRYDPEERQKEDEGFKGEQYDWDSKAQGIILGSFFYGYIITQIPGGILSERIGGKWLYGGGCLVTAIFSLLTPLAASLGTGAFIAVRILEGLGEGVTFPAVNVMISKWSPKVERSRISTIIFTGSQIGNVIAMPISGLLSSTDLLGGWPSVFYVFGALGCVWFLFWCIFVYEKPSQHPTISKEELLYVEQNIDEKPKTKVDIPWKNIFTSLPMWAVIIAHIGHNFGFLILLTEMPTYLNGILHFDIKSNGLLSALPYIVQAISAWMASFLADQVRRSGRMSITSIRKICNSVGLFGPAVCLLGITISGCRPDIIITLLSLSLALNGFIYSGFNVTHVDMSPDLAGTTFAITNATSNVSGIIGPMIVGYFTASGATIANWNDVFYVTAAVYTVCGVFYALFASAEPQSWGTTTPTTTEKKYSLDNIKS